MPEPRRCLACGLEIRPHSPTGLCPRCLLEGGLASGGGSAASQPATERSPAEATTGFVPPEPADLAASFPQLEVLELLGIGGMGAVYKARQPGLDRLVAVKIMSPQVSHDPAFAERFTREARALAKLSHPHIVAVYDFGQTNGLYYFVMEYVDGVNLRQTIRAGELSPNDALAIVPQVCEALQFAHDEGVVHRDIKPENILIDKKGRVKIADFGLAKLLGTEQAERPLTGTHQVMGTLRYMAPEQMEGSREVDHRADIYSLGVVFYELLTGELPIGRFAPPSKKVQIDVRLDEVVLRALEKEPNLRYQHASELKTSVESIGVQSVSARTAPVTQTLSASVNKAGLHRVYWLTVGSTALAWWLLPLLWNARGIGLLVSCLAIGTLVTWLGWRAGQCFPETAEKWAKRGLVATWANLLTGVAMGGFGVYFLTLGLYQAWERTVWSPPINSQEEFKQAYQGVEYQLLRGLDTYKQDLPRAEFSSYSGRWSAGSMLSTNAAPSLGFFMRFTIGGWLFVGLLCIAGMYFGKLNPRSQFSFRPEWANSNRAALALTALTVLPLVPYCFVLGFVSILNWCPYESKVVTLKDNLETVDKRIQTWADKHGYVAGDYSTNQLKEVPGGELLATAEIRQLWLPSVFDRWHMTRHGLERASPHLAFQIVSDAKRTETVVHIDSKIDRQGSPENAPILEAIASLTAAIGGKPDTPATK